MRLAGHILPQTLPCKPENPSAPQDSITSLASPASAPATTCYSACEQAITWVYGPPRCARTTGQDTALVTSPCPGRVWASVGSEATDPEALSSPSLFPGVLGDISCSFLAPSVSPLPPNPPCLSPVQTVWAVSSAGQDGCRFSQFSLLRKVVLQSHPRNQPPNREQVTLGVGGHPLSGPEVTAAYFPHAWVSGGTGGTGQWLSSCPAPACAPRRRNLYKSRAPAVQVQSSVTQGSRPLVDVGSGEGQSDLNSPYPPYLNSGPHPPPPHADPGGQSHLCGASPLLCPHHHLQLGSPTAETSSEVGMPLWAARPLLTQSSLCEKGARIGERSSTRVEGAGESWGEAVREGAASAPGRARG